MASNEPFAGGSSRGRPGRLRIGALVAGSALLLASFGCNNVELLWATSDPVVAPRSDEVILPAPPPEPPVIRRGPRRMALPIVLMHGMAGFDELGGVPYFLGVAEEIEAAGYPVHALKLDPFNAVEVRAAQAAAQIEAILEERATAKVHIIAHSQGGLDARYIVSTLGWADRVASITTISTPHRGTLLVDAALGLKTARATAGATAAAMALADAMAGAATGTRADLDAQIVGLSRQYVEGTFNPNNPDVPGVAYYSYAGVTHTSWSTDRTADTVHPTMLASHILLNALEGRNDGMVSEASSRWGTYLGAIPADHLDEIGHRLGVPLKVFDHRDFYRELAAFVNGDGPAPVYEGERARGTRAMMVGNIYRSQHLFEREQVEAYSELIESLGAHPRLPNPQGEVMVHPLLVAALPPTFAGERDFILRESDVAYGHPVYTGDLVACEIEVTHLEPDARRTRIDLRVACVGRAEKSVLDGTLRGILVWPAPE